MARIDTPEEIKAAEEAAANKPAKTNNALESATVAFKEEEAGIKNNATLTSVVKSVSKIGTEFFEKEKATIRQLLDTAEVLNKKKGEIYLQVYNAIPEAIRDNGLQGFLVSLYPVLPADKSWNDLTKMRKDASMTNEQEEAYRTVNNFKSWASTYKLTLKKQDIAAKEEQKRKEAEAKGEKYEEQPKIKKAPRLFSEDMRDGKVVRIVNPKVKERDLIEALEMKGVKMIPATTLERTACENPVLLFDALIKEAVSHVKEPSKVIKMLEDAKRIFTMKITHNADGVKAHEASAEQVAATA